VEDLKEPKSDPSGIERIGEFFSVNSDIAELLLFVMTEFRDPLSPDARGAGAAGGSGGAGAAGIVIVTYPDSYPAAASTTGSPTITVTNGFRYYAFISSGSITF
jgi:hypothetical protein